MNNGEQRENIARVRTAIQGYILDFCAARLKCPERRGRFYMEELRRHVDSCKGIAPGSPDRILRDMRQRHVIEYWVVSRPQSLYQLVRVGNAEPFRLTAE